MSIWENINQIIEDDLTLLVLKINFVAEIIYYINLSIFFKKDSAAEFKPLYKIPFQRPDSWYIVSKDLKISSKLFK
jgi:hypothetical protein